MKSKTTRPTRRPRISSRRWIQGGLLAGLSAVLVVTLGAVWIASQSDDAKVAAVGADSATVRMPIANYPQTAAGVRVDEPAVDRGKLPLNTTVSQVYELVNTGPGSAKLGEPTIEVLEGCCPPEPQLSQSSIASGEKALLAVNMQMHPGMDGPHLFHMNVPVQSMGGEEILHLYFRGDFGG